MELAEQAIKKGERCKMLMELVLETIGLTIEDEFDIWKELKKVNDEYNEALTLLQTVIKEQYKNGQDPKRGPNYIVDILREEGHKIVTDEE